MFTRNGMLDGFVGITREHVRCTMYLNNIHHIVRYCFEYFNLIHFGMYPRTNLKSANKIRSIFHRGVEENVSSFA